MASALQLTEGVSLEATAEPVKGAPVAFTSLHEAVLGALTFAVAEMATQKHISVLPDERRPIASVALGMLHTGEMQQILRMNPSALALAQKAVNHALDVFVATRVAYAMALIQGNVPDDPLTLIGVAEKCLADRIANDKPATMLIWQDPAEMAREFFARREYLATQPVHVTLGGSTLDYVADRPGAGERT